MIQTIESVNSVTNGFIWGIPALYALFGVFLLSGTVFKLVKEHLGEK